MVSQTIVLDKSKIGGKTVARNKWLDLVIVGLVSSTSWGKMGVCVELMGLFFLLKFNATFSLWVVSVGKRRVWNLPSRELHTCIFIVIDAEQPSVLEWLKNINGLLVCMVYAGIQALMSFGSQTRDGKMGFTYVNVTCKCYTCETHSVGQSHHFHMS